MSICRLLLAFAGAIVLAACGGGSEQPVQSVGMAATRANLAASVVASLHTFAGMRADYAVARTAAGWNVVDLVGGGAITAVPANARLRFADSSLALDLEGNAGQVYRLYQAAFARTPDPAGVGFWIDALERGASLDAIAAGFVKSDEYRKVYGENPASDQIVERYYRNVLGRAGDPAGIIYWRDALDRGAATPASVLKGFSDSAENQAKVLAAIQGGIIYLEPGVGYIPIARAGAGRNVVPGTVVTLDGSRSSVAPGRSISYAWTLLSKPAGSVAVLAMSTTATPAFLADLEGTYELALAVSDGSATSAQARVTITAGWWRPPTGRMPASGNAVYLESDFGDYIGGGKQYLYTATDSEVGVNAAGTGVRISVTGDEDWTGEFFGPNATRLAPGYYGNLTRYPFHDPATGGLSWSGEGRGCNTLTGWFIVDSVTYEENVMTAIDLRFEQHCDSHAAALRGRIRWSARSSAEPPGPATPPAGLWAPPQEMPGATPAGNHVYLASMQGDYIGGGATRLFTEANAKLTVTAIGGRLQVYVQGETSWSGDFVGPYTMFQLQPGYYGNLQRYPFHNPVRGGLDWSGDGRGCNTLSGWFVVDKVSYVMDQLSEIDLRFQQNCDNRSPALLGRIRWSAAAR